MDKKRQDALLLAGAGVGNDMRIKDDAKGAAGLSSFTRLTISLLVLTAAPMVLRYWLPGVVAAGVGAAAACAVNYALVASTHDERRRFTRLDWLLALLIVAMSLVFEYLRTSGRI